MVKKNILLAVICFLCSLCLSAQTHDNHGIDTKWFKGSIVLSDGTELIGFIRNNEKGNVISFKEHYNGKTTESFRASDLMTMEYFDQDHEAMRRFLSLVTKNKMDGEEDIYLFEILREFEHFAVLSLLGRTLDHKTSDVMVPMPGVGGLPAFSSVPGKTTFAQTEEIYFMNEDGERELYMVVEHRDVDRGLYKYITDKGIVDDPSLPSRYIAPKEWTQMSRYAKSVNLKIDNRQKLLIFLDYYVTLVD